MGLKEQLEKITALVSEIEEAVDTMNAYAEEAQDYANAARSEADSVMCNAEYAQDKASMAIEYYGDADRARQDLQEALEELRSAYCEEPEVQDNKSQELSSEAIRQELEERQKMAVTSK